MDEKNWLSLMSEKDQVNALMKTNQVTNRFGLALSEEETRLLIRQKQDVLRQQQRVEFGGGVLEKLIFAFCDSNYIRQDDYAETLGRLLEIFYLYKNESLDELTDDELIDYMRQAFEGECYGSLEYLEETCLEDFVRKIRCRSAHLSWRENEGGK